MAKQVENANVIDLLSSKKKAHIKLIGNVLYQNRILSMYNTKSRDFVLTVNFKNLIKAIQIASKCIQENNLEVQLLNLKYWEVHAKEFYKSRNDDYSV